MLFSPGLRSWASQQAMALAASNSLINAIRLGLKNSLKMYVGQVWWIPFTCVQSSLLSICH